ncbi:MAG: FxsA family protein [Planctomycetes bacterium]|nr:FxsA family protein [Planctomycetota bacterium]
MKYLLTIIILLALVEVPLFFLGVTLLGGKFSLLVLLATAAVGCWVIYQGFRAARLEIKVRHRGPEEIIRILSAVYHLAAGVLLISPGFLCDIIGLSLLIPAVRSGVIKWGWKSLRQAGVLEEEKDGRYFYFRWSRGPQTASRRPGKEAAADRVKAYPYESWENDLAPDPKRIRDAEFEVYSSETKESEV